MAKRRTMRKSNLLKRTAKTAVKSVGYLEKGMSGIFGIVKRGVKTGASVVEEGASVVKTGANYVVSKAKFNSRRRSNRRRSATRRRKH